MWPLQEPSDALLGPCPTSQTAVILTALDVETRAVRRHLSATSTETVSGTGFFIGRFEGWNVAVAEVGPGDVGAAAITVRACERYKPDVALFVGVAGGVKDVAIGDVVVATKVYGYEWEDGNGELSAPVRPTLLTTRTRSNIGRRSCVRLRTGGRAWIPTRSATAIPLSTSAP